jgi:F-type H+-transporting ATPase subunit delta
VIKPSKYIKRQAKRLYRMCLQGGLLDEGRVRQVVQRVLTAHQRDCLALLEVFYRLVRLDRDQHSAQIDSAGPLSADMQSGLRAGLERVYGPGIITSFVERPALIGGVRIKVGSDVYDGSVKGRLAALEARF